VIYDLKKYFLSNAAVEVVVQAIVVIYFVDEVCCIFRDIGLKRCPVTAMILQGGHPPTYM